MAKRHSKKTRKQKNSSEILLKRLADVLNGCEKQKLDVKLVHGIVMSKAGYVLPVGKKWVARSKVWAPFSSLDDDDD